MKFCSVHNCFWGKRPRLCGGDCSVHSVRNGAERTAAFGVGACVQTGIYSGNKSLSCSFFVAGRSVYLTGVEQSCNALCFQRRIELCRFNVVVFYSVPRAALHCIFKSAHSPHKCILHAFRQGGGKAVQVHFVSFKSFWFNKNLMAFAFCKAHHLIFDGRTVARTYSADFSAV